MAYVTVPKDLNAVKTKVLFNLTKRQLICFGIGAGIAIPLFFICKNWMGTSGAAILMVMAMVPFFFLAMYEKNGQPLENILRNLIQSSILRPRQRPYRTTNFYTALERQAKIDQEVKAIVTSQTTDPSAAAAASGVRGQKPSR